MTCDECNAEESESSLDWTTTESESECDEPERGMTNYMRFCHEMHHILKEEDPDITFCEMGRKLGELWRALSDEEKEAYNY